MLTIDPERVAFPYHDCWGFPCSWLLRIVNQNPRKHLPEFTCFLDGGFHCPRTGGG